MNLRARVLSRLTTPAAAAQLSALATALLMFSCAEEPALVPAGHVDLTQIPHAAEVDTELVRQALVRPSPPLSDDEERLIAAISEAPERFFDSLPPHAVLNEAELVYFSAGRSLELPLLYQDAIERQGERSPMRIRLALILQRIGMYPSAEREARLAAELLPENPDALYVLGNVMAQAEDRSPEALQQIADAWGRVLQLAPDYAPLDGTPAAEFQQRVQQVRTMQSATGTP